MEMIWYSFLDFFRMIGWQLLMFILCGIAFELAVEFIKATLYPKTKEKECPRALGMALGAAVTVIYLVMAYVAHAAFGDAGWYIPGGIVFLPVWFILFYFYQYKAMVFAKWLRDKMFPVLKDPAHVKPHAPKEKKDKTFKGFTDAEITQIKEILNK